MCPAHYDNNLVSQKVLSTELNIFKQMIMQSDLRILITKVCVNVILPNAGKKSEEL